MKPERLAQIEELFHRAVECEPKERFRLLEEAGSTDPELRREVESLLWCYEGASAHLRDVVGRNTPAVEESREAASAVRRADQYLREAVTTVEPSGREAEFQGTERFVVQRRLGQGGFGVVYQVYDRQQDAIVALKTLREASAGDLYNFKQEFRGLANTVHRNLVLLYELLSDGQQWFFTMELVDGVDFIRHVKDDISPKSSHLAPEDSTVSPSQPHDAALIGNAKAQSAAVSAPLVLQRPEFDSDRLRPALKQLAEGVFTLHQAGKLHRDLKPSNVLVTKDGRVVILDFGLVTEIAVNAPSETEVIVGTPAFMSPEQAAGRPLSEASDWYAVGVILYQALTGRLPFAGNARQVLSDKQRLEALCPSKVAPEIPEDLDALCRELLRRDPEARPPGREILQRLNVADRSATAIPDRGRAMPEALFVGRQRHLAALEEAYQNVRQGRASTVLIHGSSGIGKTALVRHFLEELRQREAVLTLEGRCYEQESVPYKALDSVVDALTQYLKGLPFNEARELMPDNAAALARVFPVLRRLETVRLARLELADVADVRELRRRAFTALRELLARLAEKTPCVVFVDDLQWGDADSADLLAEIIRPPMRNFGASCPKVGITTTGRR